MSVRLADLERLYDANAPKIFRYIYHRLGDQQLAQDLTGEAFVRFLHAQVSPDNPTAFLYRIAHNLIVDYARERQPVPLPDDLVCLDGADPAAAAELELERVHLRRAIARLTPDQQQVIVLKFLEGLSNDEIARVLDKPVGAVKALQHRGLAALRELLSITRSTPVVEEAGELDDLGGLAGIAGPSVGRHDGRP